MTLYIYHGSNGSRSTRGMADGIDGLFTSTNPRFVAYLKSGRRGAYRCVGVFNIKFARSSDVADTREYAPTGSPVISLLRRLLTVRTEWSKK